MGRWVDRMIGNTYHCPGDSWTPAIDFYEGKSGYYVVVDLAGVDPSKIGMKVDKRTLLISGHRPTPKLPENTRKVCMLMMEIDHGNFCRAIKLPPDVKNINAITASYKGGYLWIRLPKKIG